MIGRQSRFDSRLDTGNRAFWTMVAVSLSARGLVAYGACCLTMAIIDAVHAGGPAALWAGRPNPLPAMVLLAVLAISTARGAWSLGRSLCRTVAFVRAVRPHLTGTPPRLQTAADRAGISHRLVVVDLTTPFALTYGALTPRVLVSTGLVTALTDSELAAVLTHERAHVTSRDPLKNILVHAIPAYHFYLPVLTHLRARYTSGRELAADRAARTRHGTPPLAGALLKVTEGPAWATAAPAAAMSNNALLDARIRQLETGAEPLPPRTGRAATITTITAATLIAAAAAWSAAIVAHHMPACMPGPW